MNEIAHITTSRLSGRLKRMLASALLALLTACGGGGLDLAGGVGSGGSGVAEGTVSGFGSVIVDGTSYADSSASVNVENAQGQTEVAWAKLGQRVRIRYSQPGVAEEIRVLPQLRGPAASSVAGSGRFTLLGQTVQIVASSDTRNTATVLAGLSTVAAGDEIEVHGNWVYDAAVSHYVLNATRIEKLSGSADPVLVSGIVREANGNSIVLHDAQTTRLQQAGLSGDIAVGGLVNAWVARSGIAASTWAAARVSNGNPQPQAGQRLLLGAQIGELDAERGEVRVQGLTVKLPLALRNVVLAAGTAVQIEVEREGDDWKAVTLKQRASEEELGGQVELKGSLAWPGVAPTALTLRGNLVQLPAEVLPQSCASLQANDSVYVEIKARRMAPGQPLRATQIECSVLIPTSSVREAKGWLSGVTASTVQVTTAKGVLTLGWSGTSAQQAYLAGLQNPQVEVEYQSINGIYRLRKIELEHGDDD